MAKGRIEVDVEILWPNIEIEAAREMLRIALPSYLAAASEIKELAARLQADEKYSELGLENAIEFYALRLAALMEMQEEEAENERSDS